MYEYISWMIPFRSDLRAYIQSPLVQDPDNQESVNAFNAAFAILSAIGFATSMGACFFLNKQTKLRNDLWKWSCDSHKAGVITDALDLQLVCHVVNYGWKFGLVQASLELLTFIISVAAFIILKYSYFVRYGRTGSIF